MDSVDAFLFALLTALVTPGRRSRHLYRPQDHDASRA